MYPFAKYARPRSLAPQHTACPCMRPHSRAPYAARARSGSSAHVRARRGRRHRSMCLLCGCFSVARAPINGRERAGFGQPCPCPARASTWFDAAAARILSNPLWHRAMTGFILRAHLILNHPRCSAVEYITALCQAVENHSSPCGDRMQSRNGISGWHCQSFGPSLWGGALSCE
ncbi:hypothetical protein B0H13DRAFT_2678518 [Mycena leptocephala]|nr:hypothetical protein B0H13DRAFT_2678518 [Mycena leptocephala]